MESVPEREAIRPPRARAFKYFLVAANVVLLVILGAVAAGHVLQTRALPRRFRVVEPGHLYRSGLPMPDQLVRAVNQYGIRTVLDLLPPTGPDYANETQTAKEYGLRFVSLPISSTRPMSEHELATLRETYRDPRNYPILVHCKQGHARTGVAVAIWRIEQQGWDPAKAVEDMIAAGYPIRDKNLDMRNLLLHWGRPAEGAKHEAK